MQEDRDPALDPRIQEQGGGYCVISPIAAGEEILIEYPLAYIDFSSIKELPPAIDQASKSVQMAYDLLRRKVGGMRLLEYMISDGEGKIVPADVKLPVTQLDLAAIRWMQNRFRGLNRKMLIVFLKAIQDRSIWNISPVIRLVMGSGLYETLAAVEHSCEPSTQLRVDLETGVAHLTSILDLKPGDRVTVAMDEDVKWRASRENRWKILGLGRGDLSGVVECPCVRCQEGRDYDRKLLESMQRDQKRVPKLLRHGNLEDVLDKLDRHLGLGKFGIFAVGEMWNHVGADDSSVCPLIRIRFGRNYINAMLQLNFQELKVLDEDEDCCSGALSGMEEYQSEAAGKLEPERIADMYARSISELEEIGYLGRSQLVVDRVRLKLFRAFLIIRELGLSGKERPKPLPMTFQTVEFLMAYSKAVCLAEYEWKSTQPLLEEAKFWSEPMRAVMNLGDFIVKSISSGEIQTTPS